MQQIVRELPSGEKAIYAWFTAMHTRIDLLLRHQSEEALRSALPGIASEIGMLESLADRFDQASEVSAVNRLKPGQEMTVSDTLYDILTRCRHYNVLTSGLFDITVTSAGHQPGFASRLHLEDGNKVWRESDAIEVDLCGFIKGYALDRIKPVLVSLGISDALVSMGNSSVMAMGDVPFRFRNCCLTTSGNDDVGRRHIINPLTGGYITGKRQVSVITESGAEGEVLSTAMFIADDRQRQMLNSKFQFSLPDSADVPTHI